MIYGILIYVILGVLSFLGFNKILTCTKFEQVWYSIFWPATWLVIIIGKIKDILDVNK